MYSSRFQFHRQNKYGTSKQAPPLISAGISPVSARYNDKSEQDKQDPQIPNYDASGEIMVVVSYEHIFAVSQHAIVTATRHITPLSFMRS